MWKGQPVANRGKHQVDVGVGELGSQGGGGAKLKLANTEEVIKSDPPTGSNITTNLATH